MQGGSKLWGLSVVKRNPWPVEVEFLLCDKIFTVMVQRRLGLELSCLGGIDTSDALGGIAIDAFGDTLLTHHNHSQRHNGVAAMLARAAKQAHTGKKVLVDSLESESFSPGARPDVAVLRGAGLKHLLLEVKLVCPLSSNPSSTGEAGTYAAFANTAPELQRHNLGCGAIGDRAATDAHYRGAIENGHTVELFIVETSALRRERCAFSMTGRAWRAARRPRARSRRGRRATSSPTGPRSSARPRRRRRPRRS